MYLFKLKWNHKFHTDEICIEQFNIWTTSILLPVASVDMLICCEINS